MAIYLIDKASSQLKYSPKMCNTLNKIFSDISYIDSATYNKMSSHRT